MKKILSKIYNYIFKIEENTTSLNVEPIELETVEVEPIVSEKNIEQGYIQHIHTNEELSYSTIEIINSNVHNIGYKVTSNYILFNYLLSDIHPFLLKLNVEFKCYDNNVTETMLNVTSLNKSENLATLELGLAKCPYSLVFENKYLIDISEVYINPIAKGESMVKVSVDNFDNGIHNSKLFFTLL